ncbi:MAG: phytanoyl-CoA dioxygenase family protein [Planctomycetes bacterium]|nr:phytanoyl-CoA dioxygenase family protein [Planctomycetota bacterium]
MTQSWHVELAEQGFVVLPNVFSAGQIDAVVRGLEDAFARDTNDWTLRTADGGIYGARNLLQLWPATAEVWKQPSLIEILTETLGQGFGLVRVLYFDKPPEQSWALPWHRDAAIAVKNNRLPSGHFSKPTTKAGVPHVDAPDWLLENMLTARLHLDAMTDENGPLKVLPGSHRGGAERGPVTILGQAGDVLLMRPLLSHASNKSHSGTTLRRRILHFEFSGIAALPDGFAWHDFVHNETDGG